MGARVSVQQRTTCPRCGAPTFGAEGCRYCSVIVVPPEHVEEARRLILQRAEERRHERRLKLALFGMLAFAIVASLLALVVGLHR